MHPRMSLGPLVSREPRKGYWSSLNPRIGGGLIWHFFDEDIFWWIHSQILIIDDYAYESMDFANDLNLMLPPGTN